VSERRRRIASHRSPCSTKARSPAAKSLTTCLPFYTLPRADNPLAEQSDVRTVYKQHSTGNIYRDIHGWQVCLDPTCTLSPRPLSCLLSPVSCLLSPVSCLLSP